MKVFVWERLSCVSENYHQEGGLLIIAKDMSRAIEIVQEKVDTTSGYYKVDCDAKTKEPTLVYDTTDDAEERAMIFPDAGCC